MIRLRISKRTLCIVAWIVLTPLLVVGLYGLGVAVTPLDGMGQPMVLSPSLRAAEMYRARVRGWVAQMAEMDHRLTMLLTGEAMADPTELYTQSQEMQEIGEDALALDREVNVVEVPVALVGLREQVQAAVGIYLDAALLTARWLSAPSEVGRAEAQEALRTARTLRVQLEQSRWLATSN